MLNHHKIQSETAPGNQNHLGGDGAPVIVQERSSQGGEIIKRFIKGRFLGKGGFAQCYQFTNIQTKLIYAAQVIPKASLHKNRAQQKVMIKTQKILLIAFNFFSLEKNFKLMSEIKIHRSLHHTNVVGFEHFFEDNENVYIILEMCGNQTMNQLIRRRQRLTDIEAQCYLVQILSALKMLHLNRVIHRDLKLGNLFLSDKMEIKLGDFGLATKLEFEGERQRTICGTPNYIAPEILEGKTGHSYEVDIWSLGVILYTFLIGKPPFETNDVQTTYRRIRMNSYTFPDNVPISNAAKNLITRILVTEPSKRPTIDEILDHEYFNNNLNTIPQLMPVSTIACPPSSAFLKQYQVFNNGVKDREGSIGKVASPLRYDLEAYNHTSSSQNANTNINNPYSQTSNVNCIGSGLTSSKNLLQQRKDFVNTERKSTNLIYNINPSTGTGSVENTPHLGTSGSKNQLQYDNNQNYICFESYNNNNNNVQSPNTLNNYFMDSKNMPNSNTNNLANSIENKYNQPQQSKYNNLIGSNLFGASAVNGNSDTPNGNGMQNIKGIFTHHPQQQSINSVTPLTTTSSMTHFNNLNKIQHLRNNHNSSNNFLSSSIENNYMQMQTPNLKNPSMHLNPSGLVGNQYNLNLNNENQNIDQMISSRSNTNNNPLSTNSNENQFLARCQTQSSDQNQNFNIMMSSQNLASVPLTSSNMYSQSTASLATSSHDVRKNQSVKDPEVWVKQWVDYSTQYGLGYVLSNGVSGVFFNDSTKIIYDDKIKIFKYIERRQSDKQDMISEYKINEFPEDLNQKVTLMHHFINYLQGQGQKDAGNTQEDLTLQDRAVYVKKWLRTKHAILFRLSNKIVQVIFQDQTEIILSSELRVVTYVNKKHQRCSYPLTIALESTNQQMSKRLKYTKDILTHMLGGNAPNGEQVPDIQGREIREKSPSLNLQPMSSIQTFQPINLISNMNQRSSSNAESNGNFFMSSHHNPLTSSSNYQNTINCFNNNNNNNVNNNMNNQNDLGNSIENLQKKKLGQYEQKNTSSSTDRFSKGILTNNFTTMNSISNF